MKLVNESRFLDVHQKKKWDLCHSSIEPGCENFLLIGFDSAGASLKERANYSLILTGPSSVLLEKCVMCVLERLSGAD